MSSLYRSQRFPALILPLLLAAATAPAHATTWVITDSQHHVQGDADRLILLDAAEQLEAELSADPARRPATGGSLGSTALAIQQHQLAEAFGRRLPGHYRCLEPEHRQDTGHRD